MIIVGTAVSGKSKLSLSLAKHFNWQVVNTDSGWFFRDANILTSKASVSERSEIKHHCVDFLDLEDRSYDMRNFEKKVDGLVKDQFKEKQGIVIVGGSNFYNEKVIFQRRKKLQAEEKLDFHSRLKHNIMIFLNELLFHDQLKSITENIELQIHFKKLLVKETEIDHACLQTIENKLKYLLLNAPKKFLDTIMVQFELSQIYDFLKKLFPFSSVSINKKDSLKIKNTLLDFVLGKEHQKKIMETKEHLKETDKEEMLVVILYNADTQLARKLIKDRVHNMVFKYDGIQEIFSVFEKLLIKTESIFNILENFVVKMRNIDCSMDEIIIIAFQEILDVININKANRYGVLTTKGYKEFFTFFEKFLFILVNNFLRILKNNNVNNSNRDRNTLKKIFHKFYNKFRNEIIEEMKKVSPTSNYKIQTHDGSNEFKKGLQNVFLECVNNLEKEMFLLYTKQKTWLNNRIVNNRLLEKKMIVKEVKNYHLKDDVFEKEVINPIINSINDILDVSPSKKNLNKSQKSDSSSENGSKDTLFSCQHKDLTQIKANKGQVMTNKRSHSTQIEEDPEPYSKGLKRVKIEDIRKEINISFSRD